jgi:peptide/nickel transport system ATP-binding protein
MDDQTPNNTLEIENLTVEYHTRRGVVHALNGLDLTIRRGSVLGLVGETGAGKTTAGIAILGLLPEPQGVITQGRICVNGESVLGKTDKQMNRLRGKTMSMIFQDPMTSLNPVHTVEKQIVEVIRSHNKALGHSSALKQAGDMLEMVGISRSRGSEYPHQFSGGMKQRVVIAIALACKPDLLIADEPTTALDVTIQAQVLELMKELRAQYDASMLMITHDLGIVADICDSVAVIYAGRIVEYGSLEDVFDFTLHPYTRGLFNSLPNMNDRTAKLKPIKGWMPDPCSLPEGCFFHPRCDHALAICRTTPPPRIYRSERHYAECHLLVKRDQ